MGDVDSAEEALWARSLKGDGDAFGALYDRHRDRVFRHAYRVCGDPHEAEDVMATAFLELWRRRSKVRVVEGSVLPWLLVTTTNCARNSGRAARRYRRFLDSLPRVEEAVDPAFGTLQDQLDAELAQALRSLNAVDLQLISLVVFEEHTLAAAAEILKLTPGAAKVRMHRARQRLKAALPEKRPEPTSIPLLEGGLP
ncbi:RNA polymerase subunit sigma-70 [Arthrobacter sp. SW1]|uniref:RNA polymerase sigma factor n=1 Tax=Arthrobacter sp. SW1 TaxID=1920889 RepID=UPI000877C53D|nr:sigma-70 family RNA polymerase sigma factor [Arthrobacter sp. SW1]OFI38366.1 RNA polymerase subunit sigma-70 [Arthrobacter sp. SW1]